MDKKIDDLNLPKKRSVDKKYQLINAKYRLNPIEIKLVLSIISLVRPSDNDFFTYTIPLKNFEFLIENNHHLRLRETCFKIMSKPLLIQVNDEWEIFNWFSYIKYSKKENAILCRFDKALKPYLLNIKSHFKGYLLENVLSMQSEYSIRIYELLKQYEKIGEREFDLSELQDLLKVPKSYKSYGQFKRSVLEQAKKELEQYSDIVFYYEPIKPSRKVVGIKFSIFPNDPTKTEKEESQKELMKFIEKVRKKYKPSDDYYPTIAVYKEQKLKVNLKGFLYMVTDHESLTLDNKKAKIFWQWLYKNQKKLKPTMHDM